MSISRRTFWPTILVLIFTVVFTLIILATNQWDPMAFVRLGTLYGQSDPNGTVGYDGQFVYQIARDPLGAVPYLDVPAYRYQRILYPLLALALSFGQVSLLPWILIGINIVALTAGTQTMALILASHRLSTWYALPVGLFVGQLVSLRLDLNEPLSLTFSLFSIYLLEGKRYRIGAAFFALAILAKETAILFVAGYLLYYLAKRQWRIWVEISFISLTPFLLLQLILWITLGNFGLRSGGAGATSFNIIPFGGLLSFGLQNTETLLIVLLLLGPLILIPCLGLSFTLVKFFFKQPISATAIILGLHLLLMITLPFSTYVDLPGVLRLTSGLVVATILFAAVHHQHTILNYTLLWLASLVYLRFFI